MSCPLPFPVSPVWRGPQRAAPNLCHSAERTPPEAPVVGWFGIQTVLAGSSVCCLASVSSVFCTPSLLALSPGGCRRPSSQATVSWRSGLPVPAVSSPLWVWRNLRLGSEVPLGRPSSMPLLQPVALSWLSMPWSPSPLWEGLPAAPGFVLDSAPELVSSTFSVSHTSLCSQCFGQCLAPGGAR